MSASTAARDNAVSREYKTIPLPVKASTKVYRNTHVCVDANGFLVLAADTSGLQYVGLCTEDVDNSAGSSGDLTAQVRPPEKDRYHEFDCASATQAWVGDVVSFSDDHTVAAAATTTNDIAAGRVVQLLSATKVVVDTADRYSSPAAA
jgi:hypothetical protein